MAEALADELDRVATLYRALVHQRAAHDLNWAGAVLRVIAIVIDIIFYPLALIINHRVFLIMLPRSERELLSERSFIMPSYLARNLVRAIDTGRTSRGDRALNLAFARARVRMLSTASRMVRNGASYQLADRPRCHRAESGVLSLLARLLPDDQRSRFVAEAHGNLGDCDRWWQRVDHLACLALGTPRLAWIMRREGRRGRV